jgi:hypothetical protein
MDTQISAARVLTAFAAGRKFKTILADPPRQFLSRTAKVAPEHKRPPAQALEDAAEAEAHYWLHQAQTSTTTKPAPSAALQEG